MVQPSFGASPANASLSLVSSVPREDGQAPLQVVLTESFSEPPAIVEPLVVESMARQRRCWSSLF